MTIIATTTIKPAPANRDTMNPTFTAAGRRHTIMARTITTIAMWMVVAIAGVTVSTPAALADDCPNAALRAQNNSSNLPDCRAYELVTNPFKEGFAPDNAPSYTDEVVAYTSPGNFANNGLGAPFNQYIARRSASGWLTTSPQPSGPDYGADISSGADALSADLGSSLWLMRRPDQSSDFQDYYLRGPDGVFIRIGPTINPATRPAGSPGPAGPVRGPAPYPDVSDDLSHVLYGVEGALAFPGDTTLDIGLSLYEYVGTGNDRPRLVGVDNTGQLITSTGTCSGGISNDGRVVFFKPACAPGSVWARINGTTSIDMSASHCTRAPSDPGGPCSGPDDALLVGKAVDGSRAFFTTTKQLLNGDTDLTTDIYACDIPAGTPAPVGIANPCAALIQVSGAATGANVENVLRISKDGSSVYFLAQGVLAANHGVTDNAAVAGDHNLYVWQKNPAHPSGETSFIAKIDSLSATAATDDGRYFAFATPTALIGDGSSADTDAVDDVYRYDAATGAILHLSTSTTGSGGNDPSIGVLFRGDFGRTRAMTADARTIIFETAEQLSSLDTDTASDVYEWHDGRVSQITSGGGKESAITASGRNIFFKSSNPVTDADADTNFDLYAARVDGGLDLRKPTPCAADDCRGLPSAPPGLDVPSPASPGQGETLDIAPQFSLRPVSAAQRKQLAATGKVTLTITANTPATLRAAATTTIAGRTIGVGSAQKALASAGTVKLSLALSNKARTRLVSTGRLTVRIVVRSSRVALPKSTTLKLTLSKKAKSKRSSVKQANSAIEKSQS